MTLPNLAGLALRLHRAPPTAEFYTLDEEQASALEREGTVNPISQETPEANHGGTFRIAKRRNPRPDVLDDYDWFDGEELWQWIERGHRTDPLRKPWWYEDWLALYDVYAEGPGVPGWVNGLPQLDPSVPKRVLPPQMVNWSSSQETVWAPNEDRPPSPLAPRRLDFGDDDAPEPLPVVRQPGERVVAVWARRRSLYRQSDAGSESPSPSYAFRSLHDNGNSWP